MRISNQFFSIFMPLCLLISSACWAGGEASIVGQSGGDGTGQTPAPHTFYLPSIAKRDEVPSTSTITPSPTPTQPFWTATPSATTTQPTPTVTPTPSAIPTKAGVFTNYGTALKSTSTFDGFFSSDGKDRVFFGVTRTGLLYRYNLTTEQVDLNLAIPGAIGASEVLQVGSNIYFSTFVPAALYRYDLLTAELVQITQFDLENYSYDLKRDGEFLLVGTYPSGRIYRYSLLSGVTENLGSISQEAYVRSIETYQNKIYAGIGSHAGLIEYDPVMGIKTDILPSAYADDSFVYTLNRIGAKLFIGLSPSYRMLVFDLESRTTTLLMEDAWNVEPIDHLTFSDDFIHFRGISDFIFQYDKRTNSLARLSLGGVAGGEIVDEQFVAGVNRDSFYVEIAFDGTLQKSVPLVMVGLTWKAVYPTSLTAYDNQVYLAEQQLRIFNTDTFSDTYRLVRGEPKAICVRKGELFSAAYPGALFWRYPASVLLNPTQFDFAAPDFLALDIDDLQNRPRDILCGEKYVAFGTEPEEGHLGGALVSYALDGTFFVARNIVPDHTIEQVTSGGDANHVVLGTSIIGGRGTEPVQDDAHIVKYNVPEKKVIFDVIPMTANRWMGEMQGDDTRIFVLGEHRKLLALDMETGAVVASNNKFVFEDIVLSTDGNLYGITIDSFLQIDKETLDVHVLRDFHDIRFMTDDPVTGTIYFVADYELWSYN